MFSDLIRIRSDPICSDFETKISVLDLIGKVVSQSDWFGLDIDYQV